MVSVVVEIINPWHACAGGLRYLPGVCVCVCVCVCLSVTTLAATLCSQSCVFAKHASVRVCRLSCIYVFNTCATYKHISVYVYTPYIAPRVMHFSAFIIKALKCTTLGVIYIHRLYIHCCALKE